MPGSTADPKTPSAPNQYIGSKMWGRAVTAVLMIPQHTGEMTLARTKAGLTRAPVRRVAVDHASVVG
ncbi:hypothetical protein MUNTM_55330 [Mycobacterium sp. MUNTM1]